MLHVQCNTCHASSYTEDMQNPDATLACECCPEAHDHAANANSCGAGTHPGDCAQADPACKVCRSVTITILPGTVSLQAAV